MARENATIMVGQITQCPEYREDRQRTIYRIRTLSRTSEKKVNEEFPQIRAYGEQALIAKDYKVGDIVIVKGFVAVTDVNKTSVCSYCEHIKKGKSVITEVVSISSVRLPENTNIEDFIEMSNSVKAIGSIVNTPVYKEYNDGTASCSYNIAIKRRFRIKEATKDQKEDFPRIYYKSSIESVKDHLSHVHQGSQVYIDGYLQARPITKSIECPECKRKFGSSDWLERIIPYSFEYLNECIFTKEETNNQ